MRSLRLFCAAVAACLSLGCVAAKATEIVFALPAPTLTFSSVFVAQDLGFFKREGLTVDVRNLAGTASANAVIAGSAHFTMATGSPFLAAAAKGQRLYAVANLIDRPLVELVLRKDIAEQLGITPALTLPERAKRLKGLTIGVHGVGSIVHMWQRYVAAQGGLDLEQDIRIVPMDPGAMLAALGQKQIDGFATSIPFTTQAVVSGQAVMLASSRVDAPELLPFAYGLVYTLPQTCERDAALCGKVVRAFVAAARAIKERPGYIFEEVLKKRFAKMDPAVLQAAWDDVRAAHPADLRIVDRQLANAQKMGIASRLLDAKDSPDSFQGLYTNQYLGN
jgi:NitT/TauT family transport system substrate-binding protein